LIITAPEKRISLSPLFLSVVVVAFKFIYSPRWDNNGTGRAGGPSREIDFPHTHTYTQGHYFLKQSFVGKFVFIFFKFFDGRLKWCCT
jgi:hypothetical protein